MTTPRLTNDEISEILLPLMPLKDPYVFARAVETAVLARCEEIRAAAQYVLEEFRKTQAAGYSTRDREFAISVLAASLDPRPTPSTTTAAPAVQAPPPSAA